METKRSNKGDNNTTTRNSRDAKKKEETFRPKKSTLKKANSKTSSNR